jgi:methylated-DNA-[protein]-cysteine S-methyltransferase
MAMSGTGIFAREFDELGGFVQIGIANGRVISLSLPDTPEPGASSEHEYLDWIETYLAGTQQDVTDIDIGLTVPTDQRTVLERVRKIPYGEEFPLKRVVARSQGLDPDDEADLNTARRALAENPIPLLIPDHRVADGPSNVPEDIRTTLRKIEGV